jgi:hypothetical protein
LVSPGRLAIRCRRNGKIATVVDGLSAAWFVAAFLAAVVDHGVV